MIPETKAALLVALNARIERVERDLASAAVAWLEVAGSGKPEEQKRSTRALGELWRRERLLSLHCEIVHQKGNAEDYRYPSVYFLALDKCEPESVPSFREWLTKRAG